MANNWLSGISDTCWDGAVLRTAATIQSRPQDHEGRSCLLNSGLVGVLMSNK
jgi:hypothetical protein